MILGIQFEQAVYGSFPFWNRGYSVLARSAGCRDEWLAALKLAAQRFGEPPPGTAPHAGLFAMRIAGGPWMVVGVFPQGCDDQGRPGALGFHALFVGRWCYWRAGASPFPFIPALRGEWTEGEVGRTLPAGSLNLGWRTAGSVRAETSDDCLARTIVDAMRQGRRVIYRSREPIDDLARDVWGGLPGRVRRRASLATWAFGNENHFDLLGIPRLLGGDRDGQALILDANGGGSGGD